jgi:hypothetical protein
MAWSFGGGTRLAQLYGHRVSYDVDVFVTDVQAVVALSPRINDATATLVGERYVEWNAQLKLSLDAGDIDIVVAPTLTVPGVVTEMVAGDAMPVQTAEEVLAKKIAFRGHAFTHRDAFDLAMLLARDRVRVDAAMAACPNVAHDRLRQRLDLLLRVLTAELPEYVNPTASGAPLMTEAAPLIRAWLDA